MKSEIGNMSGKLDVLTSSRQETKDEGKLPKSTNTAQLKQLAEYPPGGYSGYF